MPTLSTTQPEDVISHRKSTARLLVLIPLLFVTQFTVAIEIEAPEYRVMSTILAHGVAGNEGTLLIDEKTTIAPSVLGDPNRALEVIADELNMPVELLSTWKKLNVSEHVLQENFDLPIPYRFLTSKERATFFEHGGELGDPSLGWERLSRSFPDAVGIIRVSRAALSEARGEAAMYVEFECGAYCGSGRMVFAERDDQGEWRVVGGELIWLTAEDTED